MIKYIAIFTLVFMGSAYANCGSEECFNKFKPHSDYCAGKYGGATGHFDQEGLRACIAPFEKELMTCSKTCSNKR